MEAKPILLTGFYAEGIERLLSVLRAAPALNHVKALLDGVSAHEHTLHFHFLPENTEIEKLTEKLGQYYDLNKNMRGKGLGGKIEAFKQWRQFRKEQKRGVRPFISQPWGVFTMPWFASQVNAEIVLYLPHPERFVQWAVTNHWAAPWEELKLLPKLEMAYFEKYEEEIHTSKQDIVESASCFWRIHAEIIQEFRHKYPEWLIVSEKKLTEHPVRRFRELFNLLGLSFTAEVKALAEAYSAPEITLKPEECERIASLTSPVREAFF